jgi:hypothetical protein
MKKMTRHESASTSQPPSTGPKAVVRAEKPAQVPIALPRSALPKDALMMARLLGTSSAPPTPCTIRAATSTVMVGASPQATEAAVKMTTPKAKTRRRPKRSPVDPPTRTSAPSMSM